LGQNNVYVDDAYNRDLVVSWGSIIALEPRKPRTKTTSAKLSL
jgi:hypothetical protein